MQSRKQNAYETHTTGEMAEWSNAAVLKTVEGHTSGGSNPSFSAKGNPQLFSCGFFVYCNDSSHLGLKGDQEQWIKNNCCVCD